MCLHNLLRSLCIILVCFLTGSHSSAQDVQVRYVGIENGLSNNVVNTIFQDHNGFMWFGTYDGLNQYDGYGFKVFRNIIGDSSSISSNSVNVIDEDELHRLWVCGHKEISIYNRITAKFSRPFYSFHNGVIKQGINDNVIAIKVIDGTKVLGGTQHNGLFYFASSDKGIQVPLYLRGQEITNYHVSAIDYDKIKKIAYVFIEGHGLFIYDLQRNKFYAKNNALRNANCLRLGSTGVLWLGNNQGLFFLDSNTNKFSESVTPFNGPVVNLHEDMKGTMWIASDGVGIWLLGKGKSKAEPLPPGADGKPLVNSNAVYAIYEDKYERKWIGTLRGGINIIEPKSTPFTKVVYQPSDNNNSVKNFILSFCEDAPGKVWIGTDGAGLRYWNRTDNTYQNFIQDDNNRNSISSNFITSIIKDLDNNIWLSTWFGGVNRFNRTTNSFERYACFNTRTKSIDNNVWQLLQDRRERLWACAVRNGALYRFNSNTKQFEDFDNSLIELQCLAEDGSGNIWGGDYSSLIRIDTVNKKHKRYSIGYTVRCIYEDKRQNFWIGTQEGGLLLFNKANGSFKRYTTADGLPNNTVLRILEDLQGNLWFSTYNGLSKFDVQKNHVRNFSQSDGLQSNQFSFNAALAMSSGEFIFGGIKGFNVFYPDSINCKNETPPIFLTGLKINNAISEENQSAVTRGNFEPVRKIVVPYNRAMLSLDFLGLDYADAANINYAYYLKGWDKHWNYVNNIRTANYSRLQEGDYIFEVKVSNTAGVWGPSHKLLYITVLPPWYRTWWAYGLYGLLCIGAVYLYTLYKNRQGRLQYQIQLANLEVQKEKELNEKKIAFFTNVSHEFRTPLSLIINPIKDLLHKVENRTETAELKIVYRNARRLLRLVDQLLLFKRAEEETAKVHLVKHHFYNLCRDVFLCFTEQARSKKIRYELQCDVKSLVVCLDREKIEIALFNILSNAFKYTPEGGTITFKIEEQASKVRVSISDTGKGITPDEGEKLFDRFAQVKNADSKSGFGIGLYLVKNFVEAHQGTVFFTSEKGRGTTFHILLDKHLATEKSLPGNETLTADSAHIIGQADNGDHADEKSTTGQKEHPMPQVEISSLLNEMNEEVFEDEAEEAHPGVIQELTSDRQTLLIIDDDDEIRHYLVGFFNANYKVYQAETGEAGLRLATEQLPDLIISDIVMKGLDGIGLCAALKENSALSHIPIILLTGSSEDEMQLKGMNSGADDYIKKPFDKDILAARVNSILKRRNILQSYFYNEITLGSGQFKVSVEYKNFIEQCMKIIESHLQDEQFSIKVLAFEIGMSHSNLYKKIKAVSGQSVNSFIRFIRLKKAAEILIDTEMNVNETANMVGFYSLKYFRLQFFKLFGLNPSDYIKKFRKPFHNNQTLDDRIRK